METDKITEKVYCTGHPSNDNSAMWAALMANKDNGNEWMYANQMNNPMWLVWLLAMRWMNGDNGYGNNAQIAQLQGQVADNQSFNSMLNAINQNQNVLNDIATRTSTSIDFVRQSLCALNSAVQNVAGKTELSAEKVANAVALGDQNIISQMLQCCCQNKMLVQEMGYKNELANERQTGTITREIDAFKSANQMGQFGMQTTLGNQITENRQAMVNGFANIGYAMAQQTCELKTNDDHNTQRIIDVLNGHWNQELQLKYQDAKLELSQQAQNAYLVNALKTT